MLRGIGTLRRNAIGIIRARILMAAHAHVDRRFVLRQRISGVIWHGLPANSALKQRRLGWVRHHEDDRDVIIVEPAWMAIPYLLRCLHAYICKLATHVGAARAPYDGCYYRELEWWPKGPRVPSPRDLRAFW